MKNNFLITGVILLLLLSATGCIDDFIIRGNGISTSEARLVSDFSGVISEGDFEVHITPGDAYEVIINAESNLLPYIETSVRNHNLRVYTRGLNQLRSKLPIEVFITMPTLTNLTQSGSGWISTGHFVGQDFRFVISGSGTIETSADAVTVDAVISGSGNLWLSGSAFSGYFTVSGSGELDAWDFPLRNCEAVISGSGDIWTLVNRQLKATVSGSGNVIFRGNPQVESLASDSGNVIHKN